MVLHCFAYFVSLCRHVGFQNGRHMKSSFFNSFGSVAAIDSVLVSKCMFLGARNIMVLHCFAYFVSPCRHVGFQNCRHMISLFFNSFGSVAAIDSVLVSKCMFSEPRNLMVLHCFAYFVSLCRHVGFQNGRHMKSSLSNSSGSIAAIDLILVSKCMFWGGRNPMVPILKSNGTNTMHNSNAGFRLTGSA